MIKTGGTEISDIAVGSTPIVKAYIGSQLVWEKSSPVLPYDEEVGYIQGSGTQYINTGIVPDINTQVNIRARYNTYVQSSTLCGARVGTSNQNRFFPFACVDNKTSRFVIGNSQITANANYGSSVYDIVFNDSSHSITVNGSKIGTFSGTSFTATENNPLYLFGTSGYGSNLYLASANIYACTIIKNGVTVRDFIPVRVGQAGCMYDRVSGTVFGNDGTGSFAYGSDKGTSLPYDSRIEYLESSGTQYIQLALSVAKNTYFEVGGEMIALHPNNNAYTIFNSNPYQQMWCRFYAYNSTTDMITFDSTIGNSGTSGGWGMNPGQKQTFMISTTGIETSAGTSKSVSRPITANITAFRIFGGYQNNNRYPIRFCSFYIKAGSVLIYDLIAVKKNGVGYLYDIISGTLYGNAGTGSFTLGPDVT